MARPSRTWGHHVSPLPADQLAELARRDESVVAYWSPEPVPWKVPSACRLAVGCRETATHEVTWHYLTGRAGRESWQTRLACTQHVERYAAKHGVPTDSEPHPRWREATTGSEATPLTSTTGDSTDEPVA